MKQSLTRRDFCKAALATPLTAAMAGYRTTAGPRREALAGAGHVTSTAATMDPLEPFDYSGVRLLDGMLRNQALSARDFFLGIPDDNLLVGFRLRAGQPAPGKSLAGWYGGDVFHAFGQYISGMVRLSKGLGDPEIGNKARQLVIEWAKTIDSHPGASNGFFYYSATPNAPHYIYDKTMCGLVDLYRYTGFKEAAVMMDKITDWAGRSLNRTRQTATHHQAGGEWYTLSENLYRAHEATGNQKFRDFGAVWEYSAYWDMFLHQSTPGQMGFHAYSHVNTLSSCAMAYRIKREPHYLETIVNAFQWLERTQQFATGGYGPGETLLPADGALGKSLEGNRATFETVCGSWAGFKLSRYLISFTGEASYGDWIEKLVYNGIGAALPLQPDGSTFYYSDYTLPGGQKVYHPDKWACCSGTYPQAIADYHNLIYFRGPDTLAVNLFVPSSVVWNHGDSEVMLQQQTSYPQTDFSVVTVRTRRPDSFAIKFRVPRWCHGASAEVNGNPAAIAAQPGTWASINHRWADGDRLKIQLPMQPVARPVDEQHPARVAFTYGPVTLVAQGHGHTLRRNGGPAQSMIRRGADLEFLLERTTFVPFYRLGFQQPYQMYFDVEA
jgi:hypothetical protein